MPRKTKRKTLTELAEKAEERGTLARSLLDAWEGLTIVDIVKQVVEYVFEKADCDDDDDAAYAAIYDPPPLPWEQVPENLLDPQTLLAAIKKIELDAERSGNTNKAEAAGNIRECLRDGNIHRVAKALVGIAEQLEEEVFD